MAEREPFPTPEGSLWPGEWTRGNDYSAGAKRVIAIHLPYEGNEDYFISWVGPVDLSVPDMPARLHSWAATKTDSYGGKVHLFSTDGDSVDLSTMEIDEENWAEWENDQAKI